MKDAPIGKFFKVVPLSGWVDPPRRFSGLPEGGGIPIRKGQPGYDEAPYEEAFISAWTESHEREFTKLCKREAFDRLRKKDIPRFKQLIEQRREAISQK